MTNCLLNIPAIARDKVGNPIVGENGYVALTDIHFNATPVGEEIFNFKEMTLSIYMGHGSCGTLSKYRIVDEKLDLIQHGEGGLKECDDGRYAADAILFPNFPLDAAK